MIKHGQKYRANEALDVVALTSWKSLCTFGSRAVLAKGEVFTIESGPIPNAIVVYCMPEKHELVHAAFIKESDHSSENDRAYYACVAVKDLVEKCERVF